MIVIVSECPRYSHTRYLLTIGEDLAAIYHVVTPNSCEIVIIGARLMSRGVGYYLRRLGW